MTISNYQLMEMAKEDRIKLIIIMADELVNVKLLPKLNIILNLQDSTKGGSHWVSLVIINNHAMYFDSYGAGCDQYVITYCRKHKLRLGINTYIIQDLKSTQCGLYSYAFIKYIINENIITGIPREFKENLFELANDYINMFVPETEQNDAILFEYIIGK